MCKYIFIILLYSPSLLGQGGNSLYQLGIPSIENYHPKDYEAHSQVWGITQDRDGRILLGNGNGILIYDGSRWQTIQSSSKSMIRRVQITPQGRIYASGSGDLGVLERNGEGEFEFSSFKKNLPEKWQTLPFLRDQIYQDGKAYFFSRSAVFIWDEYLEEFSIIESNENFLSIFRTKNGVALSQKDSHKIQTISNTKEEFEIPLPIQDRILYSAQFPNGYLFGTKTGLFKSQNGELINISGEVESIFNKEIVNDIKSLKSGKIAIGTDDGLYILDINGRLQLSLNEEDGLISRRIHFLLEDKEGNLWVSTDKGISKMKFQQPFRYFDKRVGLPGIVNDILIRQEKIIVATHEGVYINSGNPSFNPAFESIIEAFSFIDYGDKLFISSSSGIFVYNYSNQVLKKILSEYAYKIFKSNFFPNRIYICSTEGLKFFEWQNESIFAKKDLSHLVPDFIRFIEEEEDGTLWLGSTLNPLYRVKFLENHPARVEKFDEKNGLPVSEIKINKVFGNLLFSSLKGIYKMGKGDFFRMEDFKHDTLMTPFILESNKVDSMAYLLYGNTPFMSLLGYHYSGDSFSKVEIPDLKSLISSGLWMARQDRNGLIWLGSTDGLIAYDPFQKREQSNPELLISRLQIGDSILIKNWSNSWGNIFNSPPKIQFEKSIIKLDFSCPSFEDEQRNQFRHSLIGVDEQWSNWSSDQKVEFRGLFEGEYILQVQGRNSLEEETSIATIPFTVLPPWYRSIWFLISTSLILLFLISFGVRYFSRIQLKKRVRELELAEKIRIERERISSNLHDHVGAQLTSIISGIKVTENLSTIKADGNAKKLLKSLKEDAEESISNLRDTIWTLKKGSISFVDFLEEIDSEIRNLIRYEEIELEIQNHLKGNPNIKPDVAFNLKQILKESFQNILKHAKTKKAVVRISKPKLEPGLMEIEVCDKGQGFDLKELKEKEGFGIRNMEIRMNKIGGKFEIESKRGEGTTLTLNL